VVSKLGKNVPILIEGSKPKSINDAMYLNELIDVQKMEKIEINERVNSIGMQNIGYVKYMLQISRTGPSIF
jgi:hypothetical protein